MATDIEVRELPANGMTFRCRVCGLEDAGDPVVLLHGFPNTSCMWNRMMPLLAERGYRCLAPDQRGYSAGARPEDKQAYTVDKLAADVAALADAVGFQRFHIIGHDWGAVICWTAAQLYPNRLETLTPISVPYPQAYLEARRDDPEQRRKSRYVSFFQLPLVPEWLLGFWNCRALRQEWAKFNLEEAADCLAVLAPFSARRAALNWYRANMKTFSGQQQPITRPTLLIWGNQDPYLARAGIVGTARFVKGEYALLELDAGHFVVHHNFEPISEAILQHLGRHALSVPV
jgi:pimeloyl-ACP methyl ester carboxylesterase